MVVSARRRLETYCQSNSRLVATARASFVKKDEWPANSPDINLIENVWKQMDDALKARHATSLKGLKRIIKDEWKKFSLENVKKLYKSYPSRLKQIVEREGIMSDYY